MSAVATAPVRTIQRKPKRASEFDSRSVKANAPAPIAMPDLDQPVDRTPEIVVPETPLMKKDFDIMAFNEEPVTLLIHRSGEKNGPPCTDLISINGKWAEILFKNGWISIGYLPRGQIFTTKRKYVEALARSKYNMIETRVLDRESEHPRNETIKDPIATATFSIVEDKNPLGVEWVSQLLRLS